jgi:hypothetical protein
MSSATSSRKRVQERHQRVEIRRQLADAQLALEQAIQGRDAEAITEARRAHAEALQRLRALT